TGMSLVASMQQLTRGDVVLDSPWPQVMSWWLLETSWKSALMTFDLMTLKLASGWYAAMTLAVATTAALSLWSSRNGGRTVLHLLALCVLMVAAILYNAIVWDVQAQGRYLMPLVVPLSVWVGVVASTHRAVM